MAELPPEIGQVLEGMFRKAASAKDGDWIGEYVDFVETESHGIKLSRFHVKDEDMAGLLGRLVGRYSTLETGPLGGCNELEKICDCLTEELNRYLAPYKGKALLVCGVGCPDFPVDSIGPETAKRVFPRVPMKSSFERLSVLTPGVSGETNINIRTMITSMASAIGADCVLLIDATTCTDYSRLCRCIQVTDAGMQIYNSEERLSPDTIGVPVVGIGVPTVIYTKDLAPGVELSGQDRLTVSDIEAVVRRASLLIACAILRVAYPELDHSASMMIADNSLL